MNQERTLVLDRLELLKEYEGLAEYIDSKVSKLGHKFAHELSALELLNVYDSALCKIYQ